MPHSKKASEITKALADLEGIVPPKVRTKIHVPNGVVRPMFALRADYAFIKDPVVRKNVCYAVEALDFYRWIVNRFGIYGPVEGYLYKTGIILVDMIVESMVRDFLRQVGTVPNKKHSKNIDKLDAKNVSPTVKEKIEKLHARRSNIHLHLVTDLEATKYTIKDWNLSILALRAARQELGRLLTS